MKGIIFNLVEEVLTDSYGEQMWDHLLLGAGLDGAYTSLGSYPDSELHSLVAVAADALGLTDAAVLAQLGQAALPLLAARFPGFFAPHARTLPFLLTLNDIIHPEVRSLYPGADVPVFEFDHRASNILVLGYHSHRRLCALAEGFVRGAANFYREQVEIVQTECMNRDDEACRIHCVFVPTH